MGKKLTHPFALVCGMQSTGHFQITSRNRVMVDARGFVPELEVKLRGCPRTLAGILRLVLPFTMFVGCQGSPSCNAKR